MPYYRAVGEVPRKRHTQFRKPDGSLYAEELMGVEGFSSDSALLYHQHLPTAILDAVAVDEPTHALVANHPLKPRHFKTHKLDAGSAELVTGRQLLLGNEDVRISYVVADTPSPLYRNAAGDELVFIEAGAATLETVFGAMQVGAGDYVVLPTSPTHRWLPSADEPVRALVTEARGHVGPPRRYLSVKGQFLEQSPYCERDLRCPTQPHTVEGTEVEVLVRHRAGCTRYTYAHHPFDVIGWDGCLYPYAFSIHDFEPITGRVHQPPPVHQTFEGPGFVVCSFVPRLFDYHPQAIPAPYNHSNIDSDELIYYVDGDFMSRKNVTRGMITLHPAGIPHGPHPGAVEKSIGAKETKELAVMVDTFKPLMLTKEALEIENPNYVMSWAE